MLRPVTMLALVLGAVLLMAAQPPQALLWAIVAVAALAFIGIPERGGE